MQSPPSQTLIPPARLPAVEKALKKAFNTTDLTNIELLAGGLSASAVYKITLKDKSYVLKLDIPADPNGNTSRPESGTPERADHYTSMAIAAAAGIAPTLYYHSPEDELAITAFIEQQPLRSAFSTPDQLLNELSNTIRAMHQMPPFSKENSLLQTIESLIAQVKETPLFTPNLFEDIFEHFETIKISYPWQDTDKVPSHNDLNPSNIIYDGKRIWIVDWDAAFQNDRYVDLAITANFFVTTETQEDLFLSAYFGNTPNEYKKARFFLMRQITRLIYAMLMLRLAFASNPACISEADESELKTANLRSVGEQLGKGTLSLSSWKGQLLYGKALLNAALQGIRSPRFSSSIQHMNQDLNKKSP